MLDIKTLEVTITQKQQHCIELLREKYGDKTLLKYAKRRKKWANHEFDLNNLSKDEAQVIIMSAPPKPISKVHTPISVVQSL